MLPRRLSNSLLPQTRENDVEWKNFPHQRVFELPRSKSDLCALR